MSHAEFYTQTNCQLRPRTEWRLFSDLQHYRTFTPSAFCFRKLLGGALHQNEGVNHEKGSRGTPEPGAPRQRRQRERTMQGRLGMTWRSASPGPGGVRGSGSTRKTSQTWPSPARHGAQEHSKLQETQKNHDGYIGKQACKTISCLKTNTHVHARARTHTVSCTMNT